MGKERHVALEERIRKAGPKKILTCDGGGILGLMSVEILARMETLIRKERGAGPDFVLADYFDFVCGTSTGAVIAACISAGMSMDRIRSFYLESGEQMFEPTALFKRLQYQYDSEPLAIKLQTELAQALSPADNTLGSLGLRNLLMMVMRNASTDSPWPVSNNPFAKYNSRSHSGCNLDIPLWQLVRASTAAPTYFPPEVVTLGEHTFVFVDGGVTTYNNPAFLAFLMATAAPYQVNWEVGEDKLLIVSVGTGTAANEDLSLQSGQMNLLYNATHVPGALMNAATAGHDMACRTLGKCLNGDIIDREFGDCVVAVDAPAGTPLPKLFTYMRYDPSISREGLDKLGLKTVDPKNVQKLDSTDYIKDIQAVGKAYAEQRVAPAHFRGFT